MIGPNIGYQLKWPSRSKLLAQGYNHPIYDFDDNKIYMVI